MNKYGAIDIGTNSVRLLIGTVNEEGRLVPLLSDLISTRLGEKMWEKPMLTEDAINRTVKALKHFSRLLQEYQVADVRAVATSAVRDSLNKQFFLEEVKNETGLAIEVISGEEEAELGYAGVMWEATTDKPILMLDIGGGSTEFLYRSQGKVVVESINIGAVRLTGEPITEEELAERIKPVARKLGLEPNDYHLVGVGGTVTTVVAIEEKLIPYNPQKVHGYQLSLTAISSVRDRLARLPLEERKAVPGLMPERADIIVVGLDILIQVMKSLDKKYIEVSEADLLYGLIRASSTKIAKK